MTVAPPPHRTRCPPDLFCQRFAEVVPAKGFRDPTAGAESGITIATQSSLAVMLGLGPAGRSCRAEVTMTGVESR